jgi:hypothetical protein
VVLLPGVLVSAQHLHGLGRRQLRVRWRRHRRTTRDRCRHRALLFSSRLWGHSELRSERKPVILNLDRAASCSVRTRRPPDRAAANTRNLAPLVVARCAFAVAQTGPPWQYGLAISSTNGTDAHEDRFAAAARRDG